MSDNNNEEKKEMNECPHCKRLNWICDQLEKYGYELDPDDVAAIDGLAEDYYFPFLMKLFSEVELLRNEYADIHDEETILGHYENQVKKDEKQITDKPEEKKEGE